MIEGITDIIWLLGGFQVVITGLLAFIGKMLYSSMIESHKGQINTELERLKSDLNASNRKLQSSLDQDLQAKMQKLKAGLDAKILEHKVTLDQGLQTKIEQLKADLSATNIKLQAALDRNLHVHKLQFEKEQKVYEAIWSTLVDVQKAIIQLRPIVDHYDPDESDEERKQRRLLAVAEAFNPFLDQVNKERPFYSEEVYTKLHELRKIMYSEANEYRYLDPSKDFQEYWDKAQKNADNISKLIGVICEAIRERLQIISAT